MTEGLKKCIVEECSNMQVSRGLCINCRQIVYTLVKEGKTTLEKLEKKGKILPSKRKHVSKRQWFLDGKEK